MQGLIGQEVGGYRIISQIGRGGMATVFKAYQPSLDRYVAVKVMPPYYADQDDTFLKRFRQEAKAIASLRHPNILIVIDYGEENETTYIVMEFVEAGTLTELLGAPMAPDRMSGLVDQIAGALHYAHEQGVVHRDIKPSNILLPKPNWPLLTDFGLAKIVGGSQLTQSGTVAGTPAYMSPEQGRGERVDARSDIYSLGIVLYEMATGVVPFHAETPMAIVVKHIIDPLPMPRTKNPALPEEIERVILKALAKEPSDRFQDANELAVALDDAVKGLSSEVAAAAPQVPVGQTTTMVEDVEAAADAAAQPAAAGPSVEQEAGRVSTERESVPVAAEDKAAPSETEKEAALAAAARAAELISDELGQPKVSGLSRFFAGRGRIAAIVAGGAVLLAVLAVGATQLFGGPEAAQEDQPGRDVADTAVERPPPPPEEFPPLEEEQSQDPDFYFDRARREAESGDLDAAFGTILHAIGFGPEELWVRETAANMLWEFGFHDQAIIEYRGALDVDPTAYWLHYNIAEIYNQTGRHNEAAAALVEALGNQDLAKDPAELESIGYFLLALDRVDEAEQAFLRAGEVDPSNPAKYEGLAEVSYRRDGATQAIVVAQEGAREFPEHAPYYSSLGWWYWELNDLSQAALAFRTSIELDPSNNSAYGALASLLDQLGRPEEGIELLQQGIERNPDNPGFYVDAAGFYQQIGDDARAIELLEQAVQMNPEDMWSVASLARVHANAGDPNRARELLEQASANNFGDPWLDEFIGWTFMDLGDCPSAIAHFERALEVDQSIESAEQGIRECR